MCIVSCIINWIKLQTKYHIGALLYVDAVHHEVLIETCPLSATAMKDFINKFKAISPFLRK